MKRTRFLPTFLSTSLLVGLWCVGLSGQAQDCQAELASPAVASPTRSIEVHHGLQNPPVTAFGDEGGAQHVRRLGPGLEQHAFTDRLPLDLGKPGLHLERPVAAPGPDSGETQRPPTAAVAANGGVQAHPGTLGSLKHVEGTHWRSEVEKRRALQGQFTLGQRRHASGAVDFSAGQLGDGPTGPLGIDGPGWSRAAPATDDEVEASGTGAGKSGSSSDSAAEHSPGRGLLRAPPTWSVVLPVITLGLANRLRTMACVYVLAEDAGRTLEVDWRPSPECNVSFTDLFEDPASRLDAARSPLAESVPLAAAAASDATLQARPPRQPAERSGKEPQLETQDLARPQIWLTLYDSGSSSPIGYNESFVDVLQRRQRSERRQAGSNGGFTGHRAGKAGSDHPETPGSPHAGYPSASISGNTLDSEPLIRAIRPDGALSFARNVSHNGLHSTDIWSVLDPAAPVEAVGASVKLTGADRNAKRVLVEARGMFRPLHLHCHHFLRRRFQFYQALRPVARVQTQVDSFVRLHFVHARRRGDPVVGVHIRVDSEHDWPIIPSNNVQGLTWAEASPLEAFVVAIDELIQRHPSALLFVCSNSLETRHLVQQLFPHNVVVFEHGNGGDHYFPNVNRNDRASIQTALVEWLILSKTDLVLGSYYSSFSEEAAFAGGIPRLMIRSNGHVLGPSFDATDSPNCRYFYDDPGVLSAEAERVEHEKELLKRHRIGHGDDITSGATTSRHPPHHDGGDSDSFSKSESQAARRAAAVREAAPKISRGTTHAITLQACTSFIERWGIRQVFC